MTNDQPMIGKLKGIIDSTGDDSLILDVNGVGYRVFCSSRLLSQAEVGTAAELIIETHVREDHIHLYGFGSALERDWFLLLCSVQGVGNKIGLVILGAYSPSQLTQFILAKDISAFKAISGIGPKLAERIVTELKDKVLKVGIGHEALGMSGKKKPSTTNHQPSINDDAISALVNLGYSRTEAYNAVLTASNKHEGATLDELIKHSLKELVKR